MNYNPVTKEIIEALEKVAPGRVMSGADINPDYSKDEMPIYGSNMPEVAIDVLSTEEVAGIVKICCDNNIPVTTRGAGTGLVGGCTPVFGGVVICTSNMNKIISYDEPNFSVTVQAGVLLKDLAADALGKGLLYPPDPGEKLSTVGGNAATNAGGMRAVKYGTTRDYVKAMKVVLPSGEITSFGSSVTKVSSGYNLAHLMVSSEGTLGIITELTLKLIPAPKATVSLMAPFEDLHACIAAVPKFFVDFRPQAVEFFEREILISSEEYIGKQIFPRTIDGTEIGSYLLVTFDGASADDLDPLIEKASEFFLESGALDVLVADTPPKLKDIWAARSSFYEGIKEQTKLLDECDVVVPVSRIADYVAYVEGVAEGFDFETIYFGHAGDGNLHIYACSKTMEREEFLKQVDEFFAPIYKKAIELGGDISGEHGIGLGKVGFFKEAAGSTNLELQRAIKKVFYPKLILNPGKDCYTVDELKERALAG
ncbi:MAG: FAD-binding oxidoreductase [Treponema sp.]|nr:FAD-binding oxidoreductase [Treponema sp.]